MEKSEFRKGARVRVAREFPVERVYSPPIGMEGTLDSVGLWQSSEFPNSAIWEIIFDSGPRRHVYSELLDLVSTPDVSWVGWKELT